MVGRPQAGGPPQYRQDRPVAAPQRHPQVAVPETPPEPKKGRGAPQIVPPQPGPAKGGEPERKKDEPARRPGQPPPEP